MGFDLGVLQKVVGNAASVTRVVGQGTTAVVGKLSTRIGSYVGRTFNAANGFRLINSRLLSKTIVGLGISLTLVEWLIESADIKDPDMLADIRDRHFSNIASWAVYCYPIIGPTILGYDVYQYFVNGGKSSGDYIFSFARRTVPNFWFLVSGDGWNFVQKQELHKLEEATHVGNQTDLHFVRGTYAIKRREAQTVEQRQSAMHWLEEKAKGFGFSHLALIYYANLANNNQENGILGEREEEYVKDYLSLQQILAEAQTSH